MFESPLDPSTCVLFAVSLYSGSFKMVKNLIQVVNLGCFPCCDSFFGGVSVCLRLFSFVFG